MFNDWLLCENGEQFDNDGKITFIISNIMFANKLTITWLNCKSTNATLIVTSLRNHQIYLSGLIADWRDFPHCLWLRAVMVNFCCFLFPFVICMTSGKDTINKSLVEEWEHVLRSVCCLLALFLPVVFEVPKTKSCLEKK